MDLIGKMPIQSRNKKLHMLVILDDVSCYSWVYGLHGKSDAAHQIQLWMAEAERQSGCKLKALRMDGGTEFISSDFVLSMKQQGVLFRTTVPYTPQQNGKVERLNGTLVEMARTALHAAGLPLYWWEHALRYANYIRNRLPTRARMGVTPYELWTGVKPTLALARPFGCMALYYIPKRGAQGGSQGRHKWQATARWGMFVGIPEHTKGWLLWDPELDVLKTAYTVTFLEDTYYPLWKMDDRRRHHLPTFPDGEWPELSAHTDVPLPDSSPPAPASSDDSSDEEEGEVRPRHTQTHAADRRDSAPLQRHAPLGRGEQANRPALAPIPEEVPLGGGDEAQEELQDLQVQEEVADHPDIRPVDVPREGEQEECLDNLEGVLPPPTHYYRTRKRRREEEDIPEIGSLRPVVRQRSMHEFLTMRHAMTAVTTQHQPREKKLVVRAAWLGFVLSAVVGMHVHAMASLPMEPRTLRQALSGPDAPGWKGAMAIEYQALVDRGTWALVPRPKNRNVITTKWVFTVKTKADGTFQRYKARLVARGFDQRLGLDYGETYAPVGRYATARLLLGLACVYDWEVHVMDVTNAFLYGDIDHEIYMEQPEGYDDGSGRVCLMKRAMYGLKQSPRQWNRHLHEHLESLGFKVSALDPALYMQGSQDGGFTYLLVYVDDILMVCSHVPILNALKKQLQTRWAMKDLGEVAYYLGLNILRDRQQKKLWIGMPKYITGLVNRYDFDEAACPPTPLPSGFKHILEGELDAEAKDVGLSPLLPKDQQRYYQSIIGALNFASSCARPDIAYAVSKLPAVNHCPRKRHLAAATRCLQYLAATPELSLCFDGRKGMRLTGASDSDWAGCPVTRRSTTGWIFALAGGPVSWLSKRQSETALSSCQAEYVALTSAVKEANWLRDVLAELGAPRTQPTPIMVDNAAAVELSRNPKFHSRTKHIQLAFLYAREQQEKGVVRVMQIKTANQPADFLTKNVSASIFAACKEYVGMQCPPAR